jgi:tyrosine-protein kinase Etk/Wzc
MTQEAHNRPEEQPQPELPVNDGLIDFYTIWTKFRAGKRTILLAGLGGFVLATVIAILIPTVYTAQATFITPASSGSSLSSIINAQPSGLGVNALTSSFRSPGEMYVGILQSKTVARNIVTRLNLQQIYRVKKESAAENVLASQTLFDSGEKDNIIRISVTNHDPQLARDIANAYLDELHAANGRLALSDAAQRRLFFEQQMSDEKDALENAEVELRKTQEQTGLIAPVPQTEVEVQSIAAIRESIESHEIELSGVLLGATDQDPNVIRLRSEIAGLKDQLARTMNGGGNGLSGIPAAKVPAMQLEYVRKQREVSYHETLFDILAKQYESARLDESHDAPMLQVLDQAVIPDTKSGPHRGLIGLCGLLMGLIGGMAWLLLRESLMPLFYLAR